MVGNIGKMFGEVKKSEVKPSQDSMERLKPNEGTDVSAKVETPVLDETAEQRRTINDKYEGRYVPGTDVKMERQVTMNEHGEKVEGVFPEFDSVFDAELPQSEWQASDVKHKSIANEQLKEAIQNDPELAGKFTEVQKEQINDGLVPKGYVWHHHETPGKLQLVDANTHQHVRHTGGRSIWGGGSDHR